jgi:hypothetical protein
LPSLAYGEPSAVGDVGVPTTSGQQLVFIVVISPEDPVPSSIARQKRLYITVHTKSSTSEIKKMIQIQQLEDGLSNRWSWKVVRVPYTVQPGKNCPRKLWRADEVR